MTGPTRGVWRQGRGVTVDDIAVDRAVGGTLPAMRLTYAERRQAVARLAGYGMSDRQIAVRLRWGPDDERGRQCVTRFRCRHGIPPGVPCTRQRAA